MQGTFDFIKAEPWRPRRPERLFFGLLPHPETAENVSRFGGRFFRENNLLGKPLKTERLHVSLQHIGDYKRLPSRIVYAALLVGRAVSMRAFEATFGLITTFEPSPSKKERPLVLLGESDAFFELHGLLGTAMRRTGLRAADHFKPHMTLLYGPGKIPLRAIEPLRIMFDELFLIHSERGLTRYNMLGRWPLYR